MGDQNTRGMDKQAFIHEQNMDRQTFRAQGELVHDRIYVGGLGQHVYERDLFGFFSNFGEVSYVGIITEGDYSKGYGFVTFASKEVVRKLLDDPTDKPLVLNGRRLTIGPARQRQEHFWGKSNHPQGDRRPREYYSQPQHSGQEDPGKAGYDDETIDAVTSDANDEVSLAPGDNHQTPAEYLQMHPDTYETHVQPDYYPGTQQPAYQAQAPTMQPYPDQHPQYQCPESNQQAVYQLDPDQYSYLQTNYQAPSYVYQDPNTGVSFPVTNQPLLQYPAYPSTPDYTLQQPYHQYPGSGVAVSDPALYAGSYWPQTTPYYPVMYNTQANPNMVQYTYPGDANYQPVVGHDMTAHTAQEAQSGNNEDNQSTTFYNDGRELGDSGFQPTMTSEQDVADRSTDQSSPAQNVTTADRPGKSGDHYPSHYGGIQSAHQQGHQSEQARQQKIICNSSQQQNKFTKIRPVGTNKEIDRNQSRNQNGFVRPGRDSRMFPSPYKTFSTFTGNPSPRHFPLVPGPRPYYAGQGQGRGRGRIWGEQRGRIIQKKKPGKKDVVEEKVVARKEVPTVGLSVNHPDILQGPMEKLDIK